MDEQAVNVLVDNLYQLIDNKKYSKAKKLLINRLEIILVSFKQKPIEKPIEYDLIEYLFFRFNTRRKAESVKLLKDEYPLNSYLLQCFDNPSEINAILFHMFEYLHPQGYDSYNREMILESLKSIKKNCKSTLPVHIFEFESRQVKITQNGQTHLLSI